MHGFTALALAGLLATAPAPSSGPAPTTGFQLVAVNVPSGATWQLNRRIELEFSQPLDLATVNINTVRIAQVATGLLAAGSFELKSPRVLAFEPSCPTLPDYSDAGLEPGSTYQLVVPDASSGGPTVLSSASQPLRTGATITFLTPDSSNPAALFLDVAPGPPRPFVRDVGATSGRGTRLVHGGMESEAIYFERDPSSGAISLPAGYEAPLNLYSDAGSSLEVLVTLDQAVDPALASDASGAAWLEYLDPGGAWSRLSTRASVEQFCGARSATLRLRPLGPLPQGTMLRAVLGTALRDVVGDALPAPIDDFAVFPTLTVTDSAGAPADVADALREDFLVGGASAASVEDTEAVLDAQRAAWGGGALTAAFGFEATGGPGGNFDWHVAPGTVFLLDTVSTTILGGPGGAPTTTQTATGGVVHVRDLVVPATSRVVVQGPNPCVIWATGTVDIQGELRADGGNGVPINVLNHPDQPAFGGAGQAGGGRGGTGSPWTTFSSWRGGSGFGAFGVLDGGGQGGESGFSPSTASQGANRRGAGGGGGVFAAPQRLASGCDDQRWIGLDAEDGFDGSPNATGAELFGSPPVGGLPGPSPFLDATARNDFWGRAVTDFAAAPGLLAGELRDPWAGAGGGAGGDAVLASVFPPPTFVLADNDRGAGGGGGGGCLRIHAIGPIVLGASARVSVDGGDGAGGENTSFVNRIGGGSGGGSGGHLILESLTAVDLSAVDPTNGPALTALGGQGGAGAGDLGGVGSTGQTTACSDARHDHPSCTPSACASSPGAVVGAGGDGGPGVIQIHVPTLPDDVLPPVGGLASIGDAVLPAPVGYVDAGTPTGHWRDHLLPSFDGRSKARSRWLPLGPVTVQPGSAQLGPLVFLFGGTDPGDATHPGRVTTTGGSVDELPPLFAPAALLRNAPRLPHVAADPRVLRVHAADLAAGEFYERNPKVLRGALLVLRSAANASVRADFDLEDASYDPAAQTFSLTVSSAGPDLASFQPGGGVRFELRPRYLRVETDGVLDSLPDGTVVFVEFQAAPADANGEPDLARLVPGPDPDLDWTADHALLESAAANPELRFFRFQVGFELFAGGAPHPGPPIPSLRFLAPLFRF